AFDGDQTCGHLHLVQSGEVLLKLADEREIAITEPTLIFFPRPYRHRLFAKEGSGAQLVCASLDFAGGSGNALARALPDHLILKLNEIPTMASTLDWLFAEAFDDVCGRDAVMDRLFELLVILLLRHILSSGDQQPGMMAGLADARLSKPLSLM
nr:hypothetical protein [Tanacetum cinerariifolium]